MRGEGVENIGVGREEEKKEVEREVVGNSCEMFMKAGLIYHTYTIADVHY